jgi:hypothetical protein
MISIANRNEYIISYSSQTKKARVFGRLN